MNKFCVLHLLHTRTLNVIIYITKIPIECTNIFRISVSVSQLSTKISIGQLHKKYDWANVLHIHLSTDDFIRHRIHFPISHWPYTIQTILSKNVKSKVRFTFHFAHTRKRKRQIEEHLWRFMFARCVALEHTLPLNGLHNWAIFVISCSHTKWKRNFATARHTVACWWLEKCL